jgi:hypothetical protein
MKVPEAMCIGIKPGFTCGWDGQPTLATIYASHYDRLYAVVDAARTGNRLLIKLALEHHDTHRSNDLP